MLLSAGYMRKNSAKKNYSRRLFVSVIFLIKLSNDIFGRLQSKAMANFVGR